MAFNLQHGERELGSDPTADDAVHVPGQQHCERCQQCVDRIAGSLLIAVQEECRAECRLLQRVGQFSDPHAWINGLSASGDPGSAQALDENSGVAVLLIAIEPGHTFAVVCEAGRNLRECGGLAKSGRCHDQGESRCAGQILENAFAQPFTRHGTLEMDYRPELELVGRRAHIVGSLPSFVL